MILYIDTSKEEAEIVLYNSQGNIVDQKKWLSAQNQSEELLEKINCLLKKNKISRNDLSKITVCPGPGSYTGLRVGLSTANALAFSLSIPIQAVKKGQNINSVLSNIGPRRFKSINPIYKFPPKITQPKSRPKV